MSRLAWKKLSEISIRISQLTVQPRILNTCFANARRPTNWSCHNVCSRSEFHNSVLLKNDQNLNKQSESVKTGSTEDFELIYKFPYIVHMRVISRLKLYQTGLVALMAPPLAYLQSTGVIDPALTVGFGGMFLLAGGMLAVMSEFFRRIIGLMSLSRDKKLLKVSHLTFWGKRRDVYIDPMDVIPLVECSDNSSDIYIKFLRYSKTDKLLFSLRFGGIKDMEKFCEVFGSEWRNMS
ncbi:transmembrane protein 186-like [Tubulanus polymorphus]|uniref:transmembrane protein 186-like n=1 Tax=Tubulanus polymorphus TaxID=672921 RepID=UPI003DA416A9